MRAEHSSPTRPSLSSAVSLPPCLPSGRSISAPGPRALAMADTYAVVQKRGAPARTGSGSGARGTEGTPLYSQVMPSARRPQAPAEDAQGALPCRGESAWRGAGRASSHLLLLGTPSCGTSARQAGLATARGCCPLVGHARKCPGPNRGPGAGCASLGMPPGLGGGLGRGGAPSVHPSGWVWPRAPSQPYPTRWRSLPWAGSGTPPAARADAWGMVSCPQFLLIPALLGLAPTRMWPMDLRPAG